MKRTFINRFFLVFLLILPMTCMFFVSVAQNIKYGSIGYLKSCNGFHGISLGTNIVASGNLRLAYMDGDSKPDPDSCMRYEIRDTSFQKVDSGFYLNLVGVRTYKNKILNIYLFFNRDDGYKLLSYFLSSYGMFTGKPNDYADVYNWNTSTVDLSLLYEVKTDLGVAIFTSKAVEDEMKTDKEKRLLKENAAILTSIN